MKSKNVGSLLMLQKPSQKLKEEYVKRFLDGLVDRVQNGITKKENNKRKKKKKKAKTEKLSNAAKKILLKNSGQAGEKYDTLKHLLIDEPGALKALNDDLMSQLQGLPEKQRPSNRFLLEIFGYTRVFSNNKDNAYWLAKEIEANTCVYCNRQYAFVIEKGEGENAGEKIVRPEFDHWYDKKDFPLLSLSLFNLIPSCPICNSSVKGMTSFDIKTHPHPYIHEPGHPDLTFKATFTTDVPSQLTVKIVCPNGSKEEKFVQDMNLQEIYAMHGELEVRDLMNFKDAYPFGYLKQLFDQVLRDSRYKLTKYEVYKMLFGAELDNNHFLDRPLSKLKHDILLQIGVLSL